MPYAGGGVFPYALTIQNNGTTVGAGMQSENIPVVAGSYYTLNVTAVYQSTWSDGSSPAAQISLTYYTANGSNVGAAIVGTPFPDSMTGGVIYQASTTTLQAPTNAAYAIAQVYQDGLPSETNLLQVVRAEIDDQTNTAVNINYAFIWNYSPWTPINGSSLNWTFNSKIINDFDSLVFDGQIEFMGGPGGVSCQIPGLLDSNGVGPIFRILAPPSMNSSGYGYESSYDLNAPQPTQDVVASMLLDGERPFGTRSSNRQMSFPCLIFGTMDGGMQQVLAAQEYLMSIINQQAWEITWTPADTGLPMLFDCFRALQSVPLYGFNYSAGGSATDATVGRPNAPMMMITLTIQALPYGRSDGDGMQTIPLSNGLINGPSTSAPVVLDNYTSMFQNSQTPSFVSVGTANPTGASSWSIHPSVNVPEGDTIVVVVQGAQHPLTEVIDTKGNTYNLACTYAQAGSASDWLYVYTAPAATALVGGTDVISIYAAASGNWCSAAYYMVGAWLPADSSALTTTGTSSSYSTNLVSLTQYYTMLSVTFGQGAGGAVPTGWTSVGTNSGNGYNNTISFIDNGPGVTQQPYNIASGLANPWGAIVIPMAPVNKYWNLDTTTPIPTFIGHSVKYNAPIPIQKPFPPATYRSSLAAPVNMSGLSTLSVWFGQSYDGQWSASPNYKSNVVLQWTLIDVYGRTITFNTSYKSCRWSSSPSIVPYWTQINATIPQGKTGFSYDLVQAYECQVSNWTGSGQAGYVRMHCWLSYAVANPATISNAVSPRGTVYNLFSLTGTARSPINVQCQLPSIAPTTVELTTPATGNWVVPDGVYSVFAEAFAAGGAGASTNAAGTVVGGGGGAGEYAAEPVLAVTPGTQVPYSIGNAGVAAQLTSTVLQFTNPGLGHWTCPANVTSVLAETWGAGGAGAAGGGGGEGGSYASKTLTVTPGVTYYVYAGVGGKADTGTTSAANVGRVGQNSWVALANITSLPSTALVGAEGGNTGLTGGTNGGSRVTDLSTGTVTYRGGFGGAAPGPAGGGGGGAAGATGPGGAGGASPSSSSAGRWTGSGAGGTGTGQGGNGGAGAAVPGFPVAGTAPGGGGGGGYSGPTLSIGIQPATETLGQATVNYLGANGANGMVQLTYAVGNGSPVNGSNTVFGTAATTSKVVTAHGGTSAAVNSATGGIGGSGSTNTAHENGGNGALYTSGPNASNLLFPNSTASPGGAGINLMQTLASGSYTSGSGTSSASASSCAQGVSVVLVKSAAGVTDLAVTDSAGNLYTNVAQQSIGSGLTGVTTYAFTANIVEPLTTSNTITVTSGTSQAYSYIWYASAFLSTGVVAANVNSASGTTSAVSVAFGAGDTSSLQYELTVVSCDGSATLPAANVTYEGKLWYLPGSTASITSGTTTMQAYVGINEGGGVSGSTGDVFAGTLSGTANWSAICVPLVAANQANAITKLDWRRGATPGASTNWQADMSISANGVIAILGQSGSGTSVTAGPSGCTDVSGNAYTSQGVVKLPSNLGVGWLFTAPVSAGLAQGVSGTLNWGHASATPDYYYDVYWIPEATGIDTTGFVSVSGSGTAVSTSYTGTSANDLVLARVMNTTETLLSTVPSAPWNYLDALNVNNQYYGQTYGAQASGTSALALTGAYGTTQSWAAMMIGFTQAIAGGGGGAAGGPGGPGYNATSQYGAPGFSGGGKGGNGAASLNTNGGGASLPGGGGGGAAGNSTTPETGGPGGAGLVRLTWNPPLQPFNTLIVHKPGDGAPANLCPLIPIPVSDVPNNTQYPCPSLVPGVNAEYNGTYTVILANYLWNAATIGAARTITVTISQYEYPGGPQYSVQATRTCTPSTDIVNGVVNLGEVTLPIKDYAAHNDSSYFMASVNDTDTTDRFMDVMLLDTTGQTYLINVGPGSPGYNTYVNYFIDEPTSDRDIGFVGATSTGRGYQVSVLDYTLISGGPPYIDAGDNLLMTWSPSGAPNLGITYSPRWFLSRSV